MGNNKIWLLFQIVGDDCNSKLITTENGDATYEKLVAKMESTLKSYSIFCSSDDGDKEYTVLTSRNRDLTFIAISIYLTSYYSVALEDGFDPDQRVGVFAWQLNTIGEPINNIYLRDDEEYED